MKMSVKALILQLTAAESYAVATKTLLAFFQELFSGGQNLLLRKLLLLR